MALFRIGALSVGDSPHGENSTCDACRKPIAADERAVRLYGDLVHRDCAFYQPRGSRDGDRWSSRGA